MGHLIHPWLDCYGRVVNCPSLNGWDSITSLLDDVVQDVLLGLQVGLSNQPPNMIDKNASLSHASNTISSSSSVQAVGSSYHESRLASPPSYEEVMEESASTAHTEVLPLSPKPLKPPLKPISKPLLKKSDSRPPSMSFEGPFNIPVPAIPNSFPELQNLSEVQLQRLLNDDAALEVFLPSFFLSSDTVCYFIMYVMLRRTWIASSQRKRS